ncbi:MAG: MopE-related protein [Bdellovibrionota bacterium]
MQTCVLKDPSCDPDQPGGQSCSTETTWSSCEVREEGTLCSETKGECREGRWTCEGGQMVCQGGVWPRAESCNSKDDNCNGFTDELRYLDPILDGKESEFCFEGDAENRDPVTGLPYGICSEGRWECRHFPNGPMGTRAEWVCGGPHVPPQAENCANGLDNNCDGKPDLAGGMGQKIDLVVVFDRTPSMIDRWDSPTGDWETAIFALREFASANQFGAHDLRMAVVSSPGDESWSSCGVWNTLQSPVGFPSSRQAGTTAFLTPQEALAFFDGNHLLIPPIGQVFPNYGPHHKCLWEAGSPNQSATENLNLDFRPGAQKVIVLFSDDYEGWGHATPGGLTPEMIGDMYSLTHVKFFSFDRTTYVANQQLGRVDFRPFIEFEPIVRRSHRLSPGQTTEGYQFPLEDLPANVARNLKNILDVVSCTPGN